jgi:hypothetical protein
LPQLLIFCLLNSCRTPILGRYPTTLLSY